MDAEAHRKKVREFLARPPFSKRNISKKDLTLFCTALTHDSYSNESENLESYERLEFLGDAVVELIVCDHIFHSPLGSEGNMTTQKQEIVANRKMSSKLIEKGLSLNDVMLVGHGHIDKITKSIILEENMRADSFEALIGAFYLIYGLEETRRVVTDTLIS